LNITPFGIGNAFRDYLRPGRSCREYEYCGSAIEKDARSLIQSRKAQLCQFEDRLT